MKNYYGRFFMAGEWGIWHLIDNVSSIPEAERKMLENTRGIKRSEVQITTETPKKYAGKHK